MAFDAQKTLMLEKQYLYVRASKGFFLEGTSTERIWTNTGYYRFLVRNVADAIGNSYVTVHYDSSDTDFIAYCSDLFLEELQNSVTVAVENIESAVDGFASQNHEDIDTLSTGLSGAFQLLLKNKYSDLFPLDGVIFRHYDSGTWTISVDIDDDLKNIAVGQRFLLVVDHAITGNHVFKLEASGAINKLFNVSCVCYYGMITNQKASYSGLTTDNPLFGDNLIGSGSDYQVTTSIQCTFQSQSRVYFIVERLA